MFYFRLENDNFTQMITQFDFADSEPYFDEQLFGANPRLSVVPAETIQYGARSLVLEKQTASWCFLDPVELNMFRSLEGRHLSDVIASVLPEYGANLPEFVARLYWRGLLEIDGRRFVQPDVFDQGPIFYTGWLFVIVPTERCNLACKYCFATSAPWRQERMDDAIAERTVDLIVDYIPECGTIEFAGGEAFLEPDFIERTVKYARRSAEKAGKRLNFIAQSNGTLLTHNLLQRIQDLQITISLSLDGDRVSNDVTRVFPGNKGTHAAITRTLALMREHFCEPGAICVVSKANVGRLSEVLAEYMKLGLERIKLNPVSKHGRATEDWNTLAVKPEEFLEFHKKYLDMVLDEDCPVLDENTSTMLQTLGSRMHLYRCMRSQCGAGRDFLTFAPDGSIYPCPTIRVKPSFRMANVAQIDKLNDIWKHHPIISTLAERQVGTISRCKECMYKRFCEAGCPIESYEHFGSIDAPHPWCDYYNGIYTELFRRLGNGNRLVEVFCPDVSIYDRSFFAGGAA